MPSSQLQSKPMAAAESLPLHLRKYIVEQDYSRYSSRDHSVWRYILRQLKFFLAHHAHECYLEGLEKTGISIEHIPAVSAISRKIEEFGWRALPVSGFIPPAAFMELQSLGILPIATDIRSLDHLLYTPAPDIVHEAAGHAPILIHPDFASYLKKYAAVAKMAILSKEDLNLYAAIRTLSDIKENPASTPQDIQRAENELKEATNSISHISEGALLGRMNWWTAEYGLIGDLENPKIYGAGLLSSVGESKLCLSDGVKKLPLSIECIEYSYDITEPQPQLFVARSFQHLGEVLEELAQKMAFRVGGYEGLKKAIQSELVNTAELDSGLQISGQMVEPIVTKSNGVEKVIYLKTSGPTQIAKNQSVLSEQDHVRHPQGYSTPLGFIENFPDTKPHDLTDEEWHSLGVGPGMQARVTLKFLSGVTVSGIYKSRVQDTRGRNVLLTFTDCHVSLADETLFDPAWGEYDMALGSCVVSVFGGPADRESFGEAKGFAALRVQKPHWTAEQMSLFHLYSRLRNLREGGVDGKSLESSIEEIFSEAQNFPLEWLLILELFELAQQRLPDSDIFTKIHQHLQELKQNSGVQSSAIADGIAISRMWIQ